MNELRWGVTCTSALEISGEIRTHDLEKGGDGGRPGAWSCGIDPEGIDGHGRAGDGAGDLAVAF